MIRILEHCCYLKYLNQWWEERDDQDYWQLVHYGDHTLIDLLDWCIRMCSGKMGIKVSACIPYPTDDIISYLTNNKLITQLDIVTRKQCIDLNTTVITICSSPTSDEQGEVISSLESTGNKGLYFTLQGGLPQVVCPGKYIITMGINKRAYNNIQEQVESWCRVYNKKNRQ